MNIGIVADTDPLQQSMNEAARVVKQGSEAIAQAAVVGGKSVENAHEKATAKVSSYKTEIRAVQKEAEILSRKYGENSKEALAHAQVLAGLKDEYGDFQDKVKALNPDAPFTALGGVLQGVAGGISAAQGAMALLGVESETAQQTLLKVQAAMALSTGINSILAMKDAFSVLSAVVTTRVIPAIATTKGLLITSGVGALIAVVATLAYSWSQTASAEEEATKKAEEYEAQLKAVEQAYEMLRESAIKTWEGQVDAMQEGAQKEREILNIENAKKSNAIVADWKKRKETLELQRKEGKISAEQEAKLLKQIEADKNAQILALNQTQSNKAVAIRVEQTKKIKEQQELEAAMAIKNMPKLQGKVFSETLVTSKFIPPDFSLAKVAIENFTIMARNEYGALLTDVETLNNNISKAMENGAANGIANIAAAIGDSLATGGNVLEVAGVAFLQSAGALAQQLGSLLIGFGVSMEAFKKTFANPVAAIVAGAALIGIGAAVSGKAKQLQSTRGGGSSGGGGSYGGGGYDPMERYRADFAQMNAQSSLIQVDGVVRGNNIVMAVKNTNNQKRRLR